MATPTPAAPPNETIDAAALKAENEKLLKERDELNKKLSASEQSTNAQQTCQGEK